MYAIRGFVGANGSGKTLAAVERVALAAWAEGRPVMANLALRPEAVGYPAELAVPMRSLEDLLTFEGGSVILDEITTVASSRTSSRMPPELVRLLNQLRKADVELAWTAPAWARADLVLREVTQAVTVCRGSVADRWQRADDGSARLFPPRKLDDEGVPMRQRRAWWPNRWFVWRTYDAFSFDEWTYSKQAELRPVSTLYRWIYRTPARLAYDTLEGVSLMDHVRAAGGGSGPEGVTGPPAGREPVNPRRRPTEAVGAVA